MYLIEAQLASNRRHLITSSRSNDGIDVLEAVEDELESRRLRQQQQQQLIDAVESVYDESQPSQDISRLRRRLLAAWINKVKQFNETVT